MRRLAGALHVGSFRLNRVGIAFGARAQRRLERLPRDASVILTDGAHAAEALHEAFHRRKAGRRFLAGIVYDEPRVALSETIFAEIFAQTASLVDAMAYVDAFGLGSLDVRGRPQTEVEQPDWRERAALGDVMRLAEGALVRSHTERDRLAQFLHWMPDRIVFDVALDRSVPRVERSELAQSIVVWAPDVSRVRALFLALALEELLTPVVVVNAGPAHPLLRARFVDPADGAGALRDAKLVVDASTDDPGTALALARCGAPLLVSASSGAADWLEPVVTYPPTIRRGVALRAVRALAMPQAFAKTASTAGSLGVELDVPVRGPLVSVIVPTHNRPGLLRRALASIEAQLYRDVETLVVNDAGSPVDDVVRAFPHVRLIRNERNLGLPATRNAGLVQARGTYAAFLDDDDAFFPEHLAWLVAALERSAAVLAYTNAITEFVRPEPEGTLRRYGVMSEFHHPQTRVDLLATSALPPVSVMVRRAAFLEAGGFDPAFRVVMEDHEAWLRLGSHGDFVHVNRIGVRYLRRNDGSGMLLSTWREHPAMLRAIYERYPAADRPDIEARRAQLLRSMETAPAPGFPQPPYAFDEEL